MRDDAGRSVGRRGKREYSTASTPARPVVLTVAGSDSGGGAGIQADLKVMALSGVFGCAVVTGLTAQNTLGVQGVHPTPVRFVEAQLGSVLDDLPVVAVKTGMLWSRGIVAAVATVLGGRGLPIVVDPVMVAKGGARLLTASAVRTMRTRMLPLATVVTPNLDEAEVLIEGPVRSPEQMRSAARRLIELGAGAALVKGGHLEGIAMDLFDDGRQVLELRHERVATRHTHGTGCVLSAGIAARLARGIVLVDAVTGAVEDVARILAAAQPLGGGHGPADPLLATGFGRY